MVIDPQSPGQGASFGNAGCFNPSSVVPVATPDTWKQVPKYLTDPLGPLRIRWSYLPTLVPWLIRLIRAGSPARIEAQARALKTLLGPCLESVLTLARNAGAEELVARNGILIAYRSKASWDGDVCCLGDQAAQRHAVGRAERRRIAAVRSQSVARLHPRQAGAGQRHCLDPGGLVAALAEAVQRDGGALLRRRATGFTIDGGKLRAVHTPRGRYPADAAVLAAGAHSKVLAAKLGDTVPLETERGYHAMLRAPEVMPRVPTSDADGKFVATPMAGGLRLAGTVELAGLEAAPDWRRARILLQQSAKLYPGLASDTQKSATRCGWGIVPACPTHCRCWAPRSDRATCSMRSGTAMSA